MPTPLRPSGFDSTIADRTHDLLGTLDLRGDIRWINAPVQRLTLRAEKDLLARPAIDLVAISHRADVRAFYRRQIERRIGTTYYELPIVTAKHRTVWLALHTHLLRRGSRIIGLQIVARDLTERKQLEVNLQRSEQRGRQLFDDCPTAIVTMSPDGHVRGCNAAFVRLTGFTSIADAVGSDLHALYPHGELTRLLERVQSAGAVQEQEAALHRIDGRMLHTVQTLVGRFDDQDALSAIIGYIVDDTPRQALQAQMRHAMKMDAVGRIATGLAHDFNNLLMVINGLAEGVIERLSPSDPSRIEMKQILDAGTRGSLLAQQLLDASRKPAPAASQGTAFDLDELSEIVAATPLPPPRETILVVDDEAPVRVLLADALRRLGYHVLTAEDGKAGLALLREHLGEVRLLLTDMVMPGKSGRELAREAQLLNPALPVLFMSGYPDRSMTESGQIARSAFLQKPFALDVLALRVRQMLDTPESS
jgi:PAS domain S-box-containing protein